MLISQGTCYILIVTCFLPLRLVLKSGKIGCYELSAGKYLYLFMNKGKKKNSYL